MFIAQERKSVSFRCLVSAILITFVSSFISPARSFAQSPADLGLPKPGTMISLTSSYVPVLIKGLRVHPENPILFDFIVDTGNSDITDVNAQLKSESEKLIKYFLASLTIPEENLWVNLSPYEKDRIIPQELGQTEMGRDMLAQDYMLKQLTASLIYPEKELGREFWNKVYAKSQAQFGSTQIPVNTFNKVWIVADKAKVYVHDNTAFVVAAHLKVMLEEDYLASQKHSVATSKSTNNIGNQIVRDIVLPELEKEVNQGKTFANLRQIFHSMILAAWYKKNLKDAILNQVYSNKAKINGVDTPDKTIKEQIYQEYLKAYKKGVFNYIKEDVQNGKTTPRQYFSGGAVLTSVFKGETETRDPNDPDVAMAGAEGTVFSVRATTPGVSEVTTGTDMAQMSFNVKHGLPRGYDKDVQQAIKAQIEALLALVAANPGIKLFFGINSGRALLHVVPSQSDFLNEFLTSRINGSINFKLEFSDAKQGYKLEQQVKRILRGYIDNNRFEITPSPLGAFGRSFRGSLDATLDKKEGTGGLSYLDSYIKGATGKEEGDFIGVDFSGTNLKVTLVRMTPGQEPQVLDIKETKFPEDLKNKSSLEVFAFVASVIKSFSLRKGQKYAIGLSFAFPMKHDSAKDAIVLRNTKGWNVTDILGKNPGELLQEALKDNRFDVVAVMNDTIATQSSSPKAISGIIAGTGANASILEKGRIINLELGDTAVPQEIRTTEDDTVFINAEPKGRQMLEKMVSGKYLVELLRARISNLAQEKEGSCRQIANASWDKIEADLLGKIIDAGDRRVLEAILRESFSLSINISDEQAQELKTISTNLLKRSGQLLGAVVAQLISRVDEDQKVTSYKIVIDGSVYWKNQLVQESFQDALDQFKWYNHHVQIVQVKNASSVGAAVAAAVASQDNAMKVGDKSFNQIKSILGKVDRQIEEKRQARKVPPAAVPVIVKTSPAPVPAATTMLPAATTKPGRATPIPFKGTDTAMVTSTNGGWTVTIETKGRAASLVATVVSKDIQLSITFTKDLEYSLQITANIIAQRLSQMDNPSTDEIERLVKSMEVDNAMNILPRTNPTTTESWSRLAERAKSRASHGLRELFAKDPDRAKRFTMALNDEVQVDFSKNLIDGEDLETLIGLAHEVNLSKAIEQMFNGEKINETENRAVLHTALRNVKRDTTGKLVAANGPVLVDGQDVMPKVIAVLNQMEGFTKKVQSGEWKGASGKRIKNIINVGIGGSDLGPKMAVEALKPFKAGDVDAYFLSNIDGTAAAELMKKLDPQETLIVIVSKTFTTQETIQNAQTLKQWVLNAYKGDQNVIKDHFVAVSTAKELVTKFGIDPNNMFEFWDWVGGRYSMWSAVGLTLATYIGFDNFLQFLEGGREADEHFRKKPLSQNIPVIKAMLNVWYGNFLGAESFAILPYDQNLGLFPAFAQQFLMESNGKSVDRDGKFIDYQTGLIAWGAAGTDGQHSFYQLIHQGTRLVPADFIGVLNTHNPLPGHHDKFTSNLIAQTEALAFGATQDEVKAELAADPKNKDLDIDWHSAQRTFAGNKPTTTILVDQVTPKTLGNLVAMYEHQIFTESVIWNIFAFDQWGVELGKKVASKKVLPFLDGTRPLSELSQSGLSASAIQTIQRFVQTNSLKKMSLIPTNKIRPVKFGTSGDRWVEQTWQESNIDSADHLNRIGTGIAQYFNQATPGKIMLIGFDPRQRNQESAESLASLYAANGIKVQLINAESTPTPVLALMANHDENIGGVTILTASHSPWTDRGIKFSPAHGGAAPGITTDEIQALANKANTYKTIEYSKALELGLITVISPEQAERIYVNEYVVPKLKQLGAWDDIVNFIKVNPDFEMVLDPMQGTGVRYLKAIYEALAQASGRNFYTMINTNNTDIKFSQVNGEPNPTLPKSRKAFEEAVKAQISAGKRVMGASVDTDSDRFGNIDSNGEFVSTNDMIALLAYFLKKEIGLDGAVGKTVATSNFANAIANFLGVEIDEEPVGFKYFVNNVVSKGRNYLIAGEESSHVAIGPFMDSWDDGFVVGLMGLWLTAKTGKSLTEYKDEIQKTLNQKFKIETITLRGKDDSTKDPINAKIKLAKDELQAGKPLNELSIVKEVEALQGQKVIDIITKDGVKLVFESGDWILMRPSGTEPAVKLYVEVAGTYEASNDQMKAKFDELVNVGRKVIGVDAAMEGVEGKTFTVYSSGPRTIKDIAHKTGVPVQALARLNGIGSGKLKDELKTGTVLKLKRADQALFATPGGIDLNSKNLTIDENGETIDIHFDEAMMAQFRAGDFSGVRPVIINITPVLNVRMLLGLAATREEELAKV